MTTPKIFIVLPAFNESKALSVLIPSITRELDGRAFQIILVDDCSTDRTPALAADWAQTFPFTTIRHPVNQGYGAAIRTGVLAAQALVDPDDVIITLDADNTHLPRYIPLLANKILEGFDVVTASYWMKGAQAFGLPWQRQVLSRCVNTLFRFFFPSQNTRLYTNGFKAYRASVLQSLAKRWGSQITLENGFPGGVELFLKALQLDIRDTEIPFDLHYQNRGSDSKIHIRQTIGAYLVLIARLAWRKPRL